MWPGGPRALQACPLGPKGGLWEPIFPPFWDPGIQHWPRAPLGPLGPYWALQAHLWGPLGPFGRTSDTGALWVPLESSGLHIETLQGSYMVPDGPSIPLNWRPSYL